MSHFPHICDIVAKKRVVQEICDYNDKISPKHTFKKKFRNQVFTSHDLI